MISGSFSMVVVSGAEGDFGVLPDHSPVITMLRPGTIVIFEDGRITNRIFVAAGFAEVTQDRLTIVAEEAEFIEELDSAELEQSISDLHAIIGAAPDESERITSEAELFVAEAKLQAIEQPVY